MSGNRKEKAGEGGCSRPEQILFRQPEDIPAARVPVPARRPEEMPSPGRTAAPPSPGQQRGLTFAELGGLAERCGARHHLDDYERIFWNKVNEVNRLQNTVVSNQIEIERFHGMVQTSASNLLTLEKAVADQHCQLLNIEHFIDNLPEPLPTFPGLNNLCMDNTYTMAEEAFSHLVHMRDGISELLQLMRPTPSNFSYNDPVRQVVAILDIGNHILQSIEKKMSEAHCTIATIKKLHENFMKKNTPQA